jgi:hypothetical protein
MTTTPIPGQVPCRPHPPTSAAKPTCPGQPDRADSRSPRGGALDRPAQRSYRYQPTPPARHAERGLIQPAICGVNSDTRHLPGASATFDKLTEATPLQAHALDLAATAPVTA